MSNYLTKPYEISLWKDGPSGEERICIIGTDTMEGQNRAFEPIFSRNVNGVKKLSFKIYKKYVDTQTGEDVDNPYMPYLISERKVKLYLPEESNDNQWHDFIIKNVSENSATYLCTYQLEDALVQELSKNGFGVTLDAELMNNIGTANELADYVLRETDWGVSDNSEAFVQTIDEALVYLTFPDDTELDIRTTENTADKVIDNITVYEIIGQQKEAMSSGIISRELTNEEKNALAGKTILAFYSSCTGKPHRFQFLYSENGTYNTEEELKNYISNETDYQYYIDFDNPEDDYIVKNDNYTLPIGFATTTYVEYENGTATTLSSKYRGRRYGFSQQAEYIPILDRYVQLYKKGNQEYYGYEHAEYKSPALTQNMISNSTFESTSGWTGTKNDGSGEKAKVEAVYGYFNDSTFTNAIDELKNGTFNPKSEDNPNGNDYKTFLKFVFNDTNSTVINSGPFDNRTLIGNMVAGDEWALWSKVIGSGVLNFTLGEYKYSSTMDGYDGISGEITFSNTIKTETKNDKTYSIYTVESSSSSEESFKKNMNVRLQISASEPGEYYLEAIELFKVARYNNTIIPLEEQADSLEDRTVEKTYYYFTDKALKGITSADQLKPEATAKTLSYTTYKPVYNDGAQKVRAVTVKESNYFNILQSIAETFEAWLTFDISRNDDGGILEEGKKIAFKNYVGGDNYACFRYGVNLKDIERTFESKNIVTKLIVKNNSNEHADGGFCTIQRASANPTGENYIYDFQYFFNQGLMNDREYLDTLYVIDGAEGPDYLLWYDEDNPGPVGDKAEPNLQGYFPRIKALNNKLQTESELLANIAQDLTKYKADLAVAEAGLDAATSGIEEVREDFLLLTGAPINMLSPNYITAVSKISSADLKSDEEVAKNGGGWYYDQEKDWIDNVSLSYDGINKKITASVSVREDKVSTANRTLYIKTYPLITLTKGNTSVPIIQYYNIKCEILGKNEENSLDGKTGTGSVDIEIVNSSRNDVQKKLQEYAVYVANEKKYTSEKTTLRTQVDALEEQYNEKQNYIENSLKEWKRQLNQLFFQTYSRFIQEGTWISEEYVDDGLYYADAQSVMYNSCYPQVAYTINVISVEGLPGYEDFKYNLGEKTWIVDADFFGDEDKEPVIITEIVENLDDRSKNQIKVQNFKNQFQDLFQKITATVQQTQYNTGSYEKAVALAEANQERKSQFLSDALDSANSKFFVGKQPNVRLTNEGLVVENPDSPCDAIKMVGGAIMLSKQDMNGQQKWVTGVTSDGITASLITAGVLNAGEISIMNYDEPVFRWDAYGISAYDAIWHNAGVDIGTVISGVNTKKFVRFDKYGIYGINDIGIDGANWHPDNIDEIDAKSTFALTWEGLKVTGNNNAIARIGKYSWTEEVNGEDVTKDSIIKISRGETDTFMVDGDGNVTIRGKLEIGDGTPVEDYVGNQIQGVESTANEAKDAADKAKDVANSAQEIAEERMQPSVDNEKYSWTFDTAAGIMMWSGNKGSGDIGTNDDGNYEDPNLVFKVYKTINEEAALYLRGSGVFTGGVYAEYGDIGGWNITKNGIENKDKTVGIYSNSGEEKAQLRTSFVTDGEEVPVSFQLGCTKTEKPIYGYKEIIEEKDTTLDNSVSININTNLEKPITEFTIIDKKIKYKYHKLLTFVSPENRVNNLGSYTYTQYIGKGLQVSNIYVNLVSPNGMVETGIVDHITYSSSEGVISYFYSGSEDVFVYFYGDIVEDSVQLNFSGSLTLDEITATPVLSSTIDLNYHIHTYEDLNMKNIYITVSDDVGNWIEEGITYNINGNVLTINLEIGDNIDPYTTFFSYECYIQVYDKIFDQVSENGEKNYLVNLSIEDQDGKLYDLHKTWVLSCRAKYLDRTEIVTTENFYVLDDGSLYAKYARIEGEINANKGDLYDLNIKGGLVLDSGGTIHAKDRTSNSGDGLWIDQNGLSIKYKDKNILEAFAGTVNVDQCYANTWFQCGDYAIDSVGGIILYNQSVNGNTGTIFINAKGISFKNFHDNVILYQKSWEVFFA